MKTKKLLTKRNIQLFLHPNFYDFFPRATAPFTGIENDELLCLHILLLSMFPLLFIIIHIVSSSSSPSSLIVTFPHLIPPPHPLFLHIEGKWRNGGKEIDNALKILLSTASKAMQVDNKELYI